MPKPDNHENHELKARLAADPLLAALDFELTSSDIEQDRKDRIKVFKGKNYPMGVIWLQALWEGSLEDAKHRRLLANVPAGPPGKDGVDLGAGALFVDEREPDKVFYALNDDIPPPLWIGVPATAEAIAAVIAEYQPAVDPKRLDMTSSIRAFAGPLNELYVPNPYSGELEHAGPHEFGRFAITSPFLDSLCWGSKFADDPWPTQISYANFAMIGARSEFQQQEEGGIFRLTFRTAHSRAQVAIEYHPRGRLVWQVSYRSSAFGWTAKRINDMFDMHFPPDMPVDAIGAMIGFGFMPADLVLNKVTEFEAQGELGAAGYWLDAYCAVAHDSMDAMDVLRHYGRSPHTALRCQVYNRSMEYNWRFLLEDLLAHEQLTVVADEIAVALSSSFSPPTFNAYGDDDRDDDEEEQED